MPTIVVEFYGLARLRTGQAELRVQATTVGEALTAADAAFPQLRLLSDTGLSPQYRVSIGAKHFTTDLTEGLADGDAVLVLGADAGG